MLTLPVAPTRAQQMVLPLDSDFVPGPLAWNAALVRDADVYAQHWSTVADGSNVLVVNAIDTNSSLPTLYDHHAWARRVLQYGTTCDETSVQRVHVRWHTRRQGQPDDVDCRGTRGAISAVWACRNQLDTVADRAGGVRSGVCHV